MSVKIFKTVSKGSKPGAQKIIIGPGTLCPTVLAPTILELLLAKKTH